MLTKNIFFRSSKDLLHFLCVTHIRNDLLKKANTTPSKKKKKMGFTDHIKGVINMVVIPV